MSRSLRAALALGIYFLLSGAGAYTATIPTATLARIRSLGLIVAIGDTCMFERTAASAFEWITPPAASFLEISDWGLDDHIVQTLTTQLGARFRVQTIAFEHQAFDTWTYAQLARHIREMPEPDTPVDAYLLVLRDWRPDTIGHSGHEIAGLGLYRRDASADHRLSIFAAYRIAILDANDGRLIGTRPVVTLASDSVQLPADPSTWPPTQNEMSLTQVAALKSGFVRLLNQTLGPTVDQMLPRETTRNR